MGIGSEIKRIRKNMGLSQAQLADGLFDRSYISQIEKGHLVPPIHTIQLLANKLGVCLEDIVPCSNYRERLHHAEALLSKGRRSGDAEQIQASWIIFYELKMTDRMIESVLDWVGKTRSATLLDALTTTVALSSTNDPLSKEFWEVYIQLANVYFSEGQYERAAWAYREIINLRPPTGFKARTFVNCGSSLIELLEFEEAIACFEAALEFVKDSSQTRVAARCHHGLGVCHRFLGDWESALHHTQRADLIYQSIDTVKSYEMHHNLGALCLDKRDLIRADYHLTLARDYYLSHNHGTLLAQIDEEFLRMALFQGDLEQAHTVCLRGLSYTGQGMPYLAGRLYMWNAFILYQQGAVNRAVELSYCARSLLGRRVDSCIWLLSFQLGEDAHDVLCRILGRSSDRYEVNSDEPDSRNNTLYQQRKRQNEPTS